jgi:membrane protein DedA with SNARE-associated domain/rhodanese-related sulfurtransferase
MGKTGKIMSDTNELIRHYGLIFVFGNVLIEQLGLPIPAIPTLLLAGAASARGEIPFAAAFGLAIVACFFADSLWYEVGRKKGSQVLSTICRISLNPDSCVRQTELFLLQWGLPSLLIAKFVPGFSMVASPTVGSMKRPRSLFWLFNGAGAGLWAGSALVCGFVFSDAIERILKGVTRLGQLAVALIVLAFVLFMLVKYYQRRRFYQSLRMPRILVEDLKKLIDAGHEPIVLDVRSDVSRSIDRARIPGALEVSLENLNAILGDLPRDREIITYCSCPNEASAAIVARELIDQGYQKVRPLKDGFPAWREAGYPIEGLEIGSIAPGKVAIVDHINREK